MAWHILDAGSIWIKEFAFALQSSEDVVAWAPRFSYIGALQTGIREKEIADPRLRVLEFPMQRGYSRPPMSWIARLGEPGWLT